MNSLPNTWMMLLKKSKNAPLEIVLIVLFLLMGSSLFAQQNNLFWYYSTELKSEESNIDAVLKQIKKRRADRYFFKKPYCLNNLRLSEEEGDFVRRRLDQFTESGVFAKDESSPANQKLFEKLLGYNYFLRVRVYSFPKYQEFTFNLYQAIPGRVIDSNEVVMANIDLLNVRTQSAKILEGASSTQIKEEISNAIKRLIPELNEAPVAVIRINNKEVKKYYYTKGSTINLDGSHSMDDDTDYKSLQYRWRQIALDGSKNVPPRKRIAWQENAKEVSFILPDTGTYQIGLVINDGIADSEEDTLSIVNFNPPKILLNKRALRKHPSISLFQFFSRKNRARKIDDKLKIRINSEIPLNYELNYFETKRQNYPSVGIKKGRYNEFYQLSFTGKLKYEDKYQFGLYGKADDIYTDTSYYSMKHSEFVFYRITFGIEPLIGPDILCVSPLNGSVWAVAPTSLLAGVYLFHSGGASLALEGGVLIFWKEDIANRLADGFGLGKFALKAASSSPKAAPYLAVQVIGGWMPNNAGVYANRQHYGFVLGLSLFKNRLDVDAINIYYNFKENCLSISGGIRYNILSNRINGFSKFY